MRARSTRVEPSSSLGCGDEQPDIGETPPSLGVVGRERHDLHVDIRRAFEVLALEQRLGLLHQLGERLLDRARFVLEFGLKGDRGVVERVVVKCLLGGGGRGGDENEQRGEQAGA